MTYHSKRGKNKYNYEVIEIISNLSAKLYKDVIDHLDDMAVKDKAMLLPRLLEFLAPKQIRTEYVNDFDLEQMSDKDIDLIINRLIDAK